MPLKKTSVLTLYLNRKIVNILFDMTQAEGAANCFVYMSEECTSLCLYEFKSEKKVVCFHDQLNFTQKLYEFQIKGLKLLQNLG